MEKIDRSYFKHNFLRSIIFRLDFTGVFDSELLKVVENCKSYCKSKDFSRIVEKNSDEINIQFDLKNINNPDSSHRTVERTKIISFINESKGIEVALSNKFICININSEKYTQFETYGSIMRDIYNIYSENVDFLSLKRIGLRKINVVGIKDVNKLNLYFKPELFSIYRFRDACYPTNTKKVTAFDTDTFSVNVGTFLMQGLIEEKPVTQVTFDSDVFLNDSEEIKKLLKNKNDLLKMNELVFELYISSLEEKFKIQLHEDDFNDNELIGVKKNEY